MQTKNKNLRIYFMNFKINYINTNYYFARYTYFKAK